jgi:hypothetical protein
MIRSLPTILFKLISKKNLVDRTPFQKGEKEILDGKEVYLADNRYFHKPST